MEFVEYGKTNRLFRDIVVTEKIDGSNAVIGIDYDGNILAGTRSGWLENGRDHHGLGAWVQENKDTLVKDLGIGLHRGEWFGMKLQRKYDMRHREFALFNTAKWGNVEFETPGLRTVPVLYEGVFNEEAITKALQQLEEHGSVAVPGYMKPEGICVFHTHANIVFKVTLENDGMTKYEAEARSKSKK